MNGQNVSRWLSSVSMLIAAVTLVGSVAAGPGSTPPPQLTPHGVRVAKAGSEHLDTPLRRLVAGWAADRQLARDRAGTDGLDVDGDRVRVTVRAVSEAAVGGLVAAAEARGGEEIVRYRDVVDLWVPIDELESVAVLAGVRLVHRPIPPIPIDAPEPGAASLKAGTYLTQGVAASNADDWHAAGFTGAGVSVGVIDYFQNYTTAVSLGELPSSIACYPSCGALNLSSPHGTACAEIVHDMAPGASLTLSSVASDTEMASRIVDLAAAGMDVISASLGFPSMTPNDGTGIMADAVATARSTYGTLYVGAAGNHANYHWDGVYTDPEADDIHNWEGTSNVNVIGPVSAGYWISVYLRWNDWPASDQDYDLRLYRWDGANWQLHAVSETAQTGTQPPWEYLSTTATATAYYGIVITRYSATVAPDMDLMVWSRHVPTFGVQDRSVLDPAASTDAFSVAAIDVGSFVRESYSSIGPTHGPGGSLAGGLAHPRISGFANVDTWAYGSGVFNGTSAACPHVAGAAALVRSAFSVYTPTQAQSFLEGRAIDAGAAGYDYLYGTGRLWLGNPPCSYSINPTSVNVVAAGGSGSFSVTATASCPWTAVSNDAWITVTGGSSGSGDDTVSYSVAANPSSSPRSGTITAAGKTFTVNQDGQSVPCTYEINPTSVVVVAAGGTGSVTVTTQSGCAWTAVSNDVWIGVTGGSAGTGSGTVDYSVDANAGAGARSGTITIAGETFTVNQDGSTMTVIFEDGFESNDMSAWADWMP